MEEVKIEVAEVCSLVKAEDPDFINLLKSQYKDFLSQREPDLTINLQLKEKSIRRDSESEVRIVFRGKAFKIKRGDIEAEVNLKEGVVNLKQGDNIYSFDSFLRILYTILMLERDGFLIHACGVVKDNKGYLFAGLSGTGKTTIANLSSNYIVLSDEIVIVQRANPGRLLRQAQRVGRACELYKIVGTPFCGELQKGGENLSFPLAKLLLLKREKTFWAKRLKYPQAIAKFLSNVLFFSKDLNLNKRLFYLCSEVCQDVPGYEMSFKPDKSFWRIVEKLH